MNPLQPMTPTAMNPYKTFFRGHCHCTPSKLLWTLLLLALCFSQGVSADTLTASTDRTQIGLEETLTLTVHYDEQIMFGEPDFEALKQDFDILSNRRANQYRSINGVAQSSTEWTITLAPKREGRLKIPSFHYKQSSSDPITISVNKRPQPTLQSPDQPVFIETELQKSTGYVQEQILYTVRLFTSVDLSGLNSEEFRVDHALVKQVSENQFQKVVKGRRYGVVEITYAIFAQQSGTLTLPSTLWNVTLQNNRSLAYDPFMSHSGKLLRLRTPEKTMEILPKPDHYSGSDWLPATDITLSQRWSGDPETFKLGEPITRQINIVAEGLMAAQLPPLQLQTVDGVKYYPDQPQTEEKLSNRGITTLKTESYAIVPNQSGELTLPAITLTWWDVDQQTTRIATLPAETIKVSPATVSTPAPTQAETSQSLPIELPVQPDTPRDNSGGASSLWFYLTILFSFTTLLFAVLWLRARRISPDTRANDLHNLAAANERKAYRLLLKSLKSEGPAEIREALLRWGQSRYSEHPITSLAALGKYLPELNDEMVTLEKQLYAQEATEYDSSGLIRKLKEINRVKTSENRGSHDGELPPLYR